MYDTVYINRPEFKTTWTTEWQTKDLECKLDKYTITKEGRLILHVYEYEEVPKAERPYPDAPEDDYRSYMGSSRITSVTLEDTNYHGSLNLINCATLDQCQVKFTDGNFINVTPTSNGHSARTQRSKYLTDAGLLPKEGS